MKPQRTRHWLGIAGLGALVCAPSFAQERPYGYGGLSIGRARADLNEARIAGRQLGFGNSATSFVSDERDNAGRVFLGVQFNPRIALEVGYFDLGKFHFAALTSPAGTLAGEIKSRGVAVDAVGSFPVTQSLSLLLRGGAQYARTRGTFAGSGGFTPLNNRSRENEWEPKVGAGLQWAFTRNFWMRLEAERYRINDTYNRKTSVDMLSVSLVFPFGRSDPAPRIAAAPPPAVTAAAAAGPAAGRAGAAAPPVASPPPPPPAPPPRRRVTFEAETLFGFDRAEVQEQGRAALDRFIGETQGLEYDSIVVEGHADRIGSERYNLELSQRRADVVKNYLSGQGRLPAERITATGKGESQPVTQAGQCPGNRPTRALIACLAPDRRVDVEVNGIR